MAGMRRGRPQAAILRPRTARPGPANATHGQAAPQVAWRGDANSVIPELIVRRGLAGWCGLVEANAVRSGGDVLHLPAVPGAWADARIEVRVSALVEFGVQRVEVAHHDKHGRPWRSIVVMGGQVELHAVA